MEYWTSGETGGRQLGEMLAGPAATQVLSRPSAAVQHKDRSSSQMTSGPETRYRVRGGNQLQGTVFVQGAKNAALKMIAASLLAEKGQTVLHNVPLIDDVRAAVDLARAVGAQVQFHEAERVVVVDASTLNSPVLPASVAGRFRASILFLPPLLLRLGEAVLEDVGGCRLGSRNLDFHYRGFARLGAQVEESGSSIRLQISDLRAVSLYLDTPSHTGTENLVAAASLIDGTTVIENTAMEPEVVDFARFLSAMGARVDGAGTGQIEVEGVKELTAVEYTVMPDRIDFGALAMMAAATGGDVTIVGAKLDHLGVARWKLEQMGVELESSGAVVRVRRPGPLRPINVVTAPFPGFSQAPGKARRPEGSQSVPRLATPQKSSQGPWRRSASLSAPIEAEMRLRPGLLVAERVHFTSSAAWPHGPGRRRCH